MAPTDKIYSARVVDKGLHTAVQEFRHPDGRVITIVGCVHMAEPDYFAQVARTVKRLEFAGATVYLEGVGFADSRLNKGSWPVDIQHATQVQREAIDIQFNRLPELFDLPWIYQGDERSALTPYPDTWRQSDCSSYDMALLLGPLNTPLVTPLADTYDQVAQAKVNNPFVFAVQREQFVRETLRPFMNQRTASRAILKVMRATIGVVVRPIAAAIRGMRRAPAPPTRAWTQPLIYTYRECVGAIAALRHDRDAVLLWHPEHAEGLGRILCRNGFIPQEPSAWLHATHAPPDPRKQPKPQKPRRSASAA